MVAAFGLEWVPATVRPRVALLSTGDEVREPGEPHAPGIIYSNNRFLLGWLARLNGGLPLHLGICRDDPVEISDRLEHMEADLYVTTGGTGRGDKDVVLNAWSRLGVETVFKGVDISPGRGTLAGLRRGKAYLALPGGPWAGRIVFEELIKPLLWRFQGIRFRWPPSLKALLADRVVNEEGGCRALAGELYMQRPMATFLPLGRRGGAVLGEVRRSIGYMLLEPDMLEMAAGVEVDVRLFDLPLSASALLDKGRRSG